MKSAIQFIKENNIENVDVSNPQTMLVCTACGILVSVQQAFANDEGFLYCPACAKEANTDV